MDFWDIVLQQSEYILRIIVSALCGAFIGFERKNRMKAAGVRTHLMVALASAMMMVVSKYAFGDVIIYDSINLDPSRVAAGIVTGISFLGAGLILVRSNHEVSGVTTAAGIWATVGVGMTIGAGMYYIGIVATLLILLNQFILHRNLKFLREPLSDVVVLKIEAKSTAIDEIRSVLITNHVEISHIKIKDIGDDKTTMEMSCRFPNQYNIDDMVSLCRCLPEVSSFSI